MTDAPGPRLVQFPVADLSDIPARLRGMADRIESNEVKPTAVVLVLVDADGEVVVKGYGNVPTRLYAVGVLHAASEHLLGHPR